MPAFGQDVNVYVSSKAGDRLTPKPGVRFEEQKAATGPVFLIATGNMLQPIVGFGASFLEAGMICLRDLPLAEQESVLRSLSIRPGRRLLGDEDSHCRYHFMSAGPYLYTYDDTPGEWK